jgi:hypothetical protein
VKLLKFADINFPLFALRTAPYEVLYDDETIKIRKRENSHIETVDNRRLGGDYFSRLLQMKQRVVFDVTCRNTQDCILSKVKWGIDSKAIVHNLTKKHSVPAKSARIKRTKNNLIWVQGISYPFKLHTNEELDIQERTYARIVKVNNEWLLHSFSYEISNRKFEFV